MYAVDAVAQEIVIDDVNYEQQYKALHKRLKDRSLGKGTITLIIRDPNITIIGDMHDDWRDDEEWGDDDDWDDDDDDKDKFCGCRSLLHAISRDAQNSRSWAMMCFTGAPP